MPDIKMMMTHYRWNKWKAIPDGQKHDQWLNTLQKQLHKYKVVNDLLGACL